MTASALYLHFNAAGISFAPFNRRSLPENLKEMESISPVPKGGVVCQTCGDKGFTNAFVYCVKCLEYVIHRYCLKVMPNTFTEAVIWYCETCKPAVQNQVKSSPSHKNIDPIWSDTSSSDSDSSSISCSNWKEFDEWQARISQQNHRIDRIIDDMVISYPSLILGDNLFTPKKESDIVEETKEVLSQLPKFENIKQDDFYVHAQPIIDPVWRGSLSVGDDIFEGLVGHLSNKACGKVSEEANIMPSLLHLQMHPETPLWPKNTLPSDDDIALYFFPGDPVNERAFEGLVVDMMDGGLAMRATVKNADLLVFTSAALPPLFRRFQGKYYLWGVFRAKRKGKE
ncbi:hypothetical protein LXL04_018801 [Taraxacum kok-saghyz]